MSLVRCNSQRLFAVGQLNPGTPHHVPAVCTGRVNSPAATAGLGLRRVEAGLGLGCCLRLPHHGPQACCGVKAGSAASGHLYPSSHNNGDGGSSNSSGTSSSTTSGTAAGGVGGGKGGQPMAPEAPKASSSSSAPASGSSTTPAVAPPSMPNIAASDSAFTLKPIHIALFTLVFVGGALFATCTLQFTTDMEFTVAVATVLRRVARSVAFRQLVVIAGAILLVRFGLNSALQALTRWSASPVQWDKTKLYYILREVYQPLELLLCIAALCTIADSFVPSLISVPKTTVTHLVKSVLSMSFIVSAASVIHNLKGRFCKENAWQSEMKGDVTAQRRWEAYDKLATFSIYAVSFVLGIQAIGLEVTSVLAIGGVGGLAIGLAGREIAENLLNGFLIMSTNPFEVGDEVIFYHANKQVEGFVIDIGWYRTLIRSFEREIFVIPNAVFSKNILLNVTRKNREFRFFEFINVRVKDASQVNAIVQDIRRIVRSDTRILSKLHRRIFLDKISIEECKIYVSFYVEAQNRDQFMAMKQDMLLAFVDCVERNEAQLATPRRTMDLDPELVAAVVAAVSAYERASRQNNNSSLLPAGRGAEFGDEGMGSGAVMVEDMATSSWSSAATAPSLDVSKRDDSSRQDDIIVTISSGSVGSSDSLSSLDRGGVPSAPPPATLPAPPPERSASVSPSKIAERSLVRVGGGGASTSSSTGGTSSTDGGQYEVPVTVGSSSSGVRNNIVEAPSMLRATGAGSAAMALEPRQWRRNWWEMTLRSLASALFD